MFSLEISADLPGDSTAAVWAPVLGGRPVEMASTGTLRDWWVLALATLAVACGLALVIVLLVRVLRRGRAPGRPAMSSGSPAGPIHDSVPTSPEEPPMPTA